MACYGAAGIETVPAAEYEARVAFAAIALAAGSANAQEKLNVRLDWSSSGYHSPIHLANQKGWFKEAGLNVEVLDGKGSVGTINQVAASLSQRNDEDFILIYRDKATDEWVIELNDNLDGMLVANLLGVFQGRMLELMMQQHQEAKPSAPEVERLEVAKKASA